MSLAFRNGVNCVAFSLCEGPYGKQQKDVVGVKSPLTSPKVECQGQQGDSGQEVIVLFAIHRRFVHAVGG